MSSNRKIKKLGYGVAIHYNEYQDIFEVYKIGTYHPGSPDMNKENQVVCRDKKLKRAIRKFQNNF